MIRENKLKYLISSILIILPSIVSLFIKDRLEGAYMGAWNFTWIMPLVLFALHTGLLILTRYIDPVKQGKKIENVIFFTIPTLSIYVGAISIALMLGLEFNVGIICSALMGIAFIFMGNYLPKAKRNRTFGIKIRWTLANDANWAATHRFCGRLYVIAGIITLLLGFLPYKAAIIAIAVILVGTVIAPIVYSYRFYKRQLASGEATVEDYSGGSVGASKKSKAAVIISVVCVVLVVAVLMFVGSISFTLGDDALRIKTTFGGGTTLRYSDLKGATVEYREEAIDGIRVMGYASMRLLYGQFRNDEFGNYVRYTYTKADAYVVIYLGEDVIVLADKTAELTKSLYDGLIDKIAEAEN